jgi:PAS domain S-box-containing protein
VIEWDDNFTVKRLNDAAEEILGYAEADLRGRGWNVIVSESDEPGAGDVVSELLDGTVGYHSINENVTKEGETIVCEWHNRIVTDEDGDVVAIFSQLQDATERRRHREELERHRAIIQAAANTIITIPSANPSVEGTFGYAPEEVVGEPLTMLMADDVAERHTTAFERYLDTTERTLDWEDTEFEGQHRDGSTVPLAVTFGEVVYEDERYFVGILRDLTDQREREQELEGANALLSTLIETLPAGVIAEDGSRNVLTVNQRLIDLFGMSESPAGA